MRKLISVALVLALASIVAPTTGAETVTKEYIDAIGARVAGVGTSLTVCPGTADVPEGCDLDGDGVSDLQNVGAGRLFASGLYSNVVVTANDEGLWGTNSALSVCFYNPDGDFICDADDISSGTDCGPAIILGAAFPSGNVAAFVYNVVATEELDVCGDTFGVVTADFF